MAITPEQAQAELDRRQNSSVGTSAFTPEQAQAELARRNAPPKEKEEWYEDFGEGLGVSGLSTYYGIKDLFGATDDEDRATLADWKEDAGESGYGTAGRVLGEVVQMAVPMGAGLKLAKGAGMVAKAARLATAGKYAPLAMEAAVATGHGALQLPEAGRSRGQNALESGAMALAGGAAVKGLGKALKGVTKSEAAKSLIKSGVKLTPADAVAKGHPLKNLESIASYIPFLAKGVKKARDESLRTFGDHITNVVGKKFGVTISGLGDDAMKQMDGLIKEGYEEAWAKAPEISVSAIDDIATAAAKIKPVGSAETIINKIIKEADSILPKTKTSADKYMGVGSAKTDMEAVSTLDKLIRSSKATGDPHGINSVLDDMSKAIRNNLPKGAKDAVDEMDAIFPAYKVVEDALNAAASKTHKAKDVLIDPMKLLGSSVAKGKKGMKGARGEAPLQKVAREGVETIGREGIALPIMDVLKAGSTALPAVPFMGAAGRAVLGDTAVQQVGRGFAKRYTNPLAKALRAKTGVGGATVGAAYEQ
tara:strand:- start:8 stop:1612 length:1605 start_codon:yes stop_codon:yes gene_type:complete